MDSLQASFEADLHAAWQAKDFPRWQEIRAVYADFLEEKGQPLQYMARAKCTMLPRTLKTKNGATHVWMWRLHFSLPEKTALLYSGRRAIARSRWYANKRMNGLPLLGFPRATVRCVGWEQPGQSVPALLGGAARFTVTFKPRAERRWRSHRQRMLTGGEWIDVPFDTDVHPLGFPAMFLPPEWMKEVEAGTVQGSLFSETLNA